MRKTGVMAMIVFLALSSVSKAQYWVEFNPGTCKVGPPPACVAGHWHPVYPPEQASIKSAASTSTQKTEAKKYSDVSTDVEYESFKVGGAAGSIGGKSVGARAMYLHSGANGFGGGTLVTYERSTIDGAGQGTPATNNLVGHGFVIADLGKHLFSADQRLTNSLTGSAGLSFSAIKPGGDSPTTSTYGPFASANYQRMVGPASYGVTLSYSIAKLSLSDGLAPPTTTAGSWALGFTGGYALSPNTQFNGDFYNLNGGPTVVGGSLTQSFSETFAITAGARKLFGSDNFSNLKLTIGTLFRAY